MMNPESLDTGSEAEVLFRINLEMFIFMMNAIHIGNEFSPAVLQSLCNKTIAGWWQSLLWISYIK